MKTLSVVSDKSISYEKQTQAYSTWGDKLLQHTDVLHAIQNKHEFRPITIQLAPTEACDSDCSFCSVQGRPINRKIAWADIERGLSEFRELGAKSIEITGGGNPLLYRDGQRNINDIIVRAHDLGYEIGVITNSEHIAAHIDPRHADKITWLRVSMIKLDEGKTHDDFNFSGFPIEKIGLSYIIYAGTTRNSIDQIARVVARYPNLKFVRVAPDCLTDDALTIKNDWGDIVEELNQTKKFFIKEINEDYHPHEGGCWVGMLRPYWVWNGVYICTSHVLKHRNYHDTWKLCEHAEIKKTWDEMNARFKAGLPPYKIDIKSECWHCYYANNNKLLDTVITPLPDKNFA